MTAFDSACTVVTCLFVVAVIRVLYMLWNIMMCKCSLIREHTIKTIFCIGSGGHTTELLRFMKSLNMKKYQPRMYISADNDTSSEVKIQEMEKPQQDYSLARIPRSRNVQQSYLSSVISTLHATLCTFPVIYNFQPDVIFCNGPGTCIPVCVVAFILRCLFLVDCRVVFIESICRVRTLSLTGKILQFIADVIIVQWPQMTDTCFRAKYFGRLT